jgi:two-component system, NarL family, response regulator DesR
VYGSARLPLAERVTPSTMRRRAWRARHGCPFVHPGQSLADLDARALQQRAPEDDVIHIVLVEPTGLWRRALALALTNEGDIDVVAELARIEEATAIAEAVRPEVVVADIDPFADSDHFAATHEISKALPDGALLVLADPAGPGVMREVLGPHVRGLFGKDSGPRALAQCIRRVAKGERVIDPRLAVAALCAPANPLTAREREILRVATSGVPSIEIAARLHLSVGTVRNYLSMIIRKTGGRNRMEAVRLAEEAGWL